LWTICPGRPPASISDSQVTRITGVSHTHLANFPFSWSWGKCAYCIGLLHSQIFKNNTIAMKTINILYYFKYFQIFLYLYE
jgi:hypothetical protein